MIPLSLKLKNSIGVKKGLGRDEFYIDYTEFEPGIIGIIGPTGSGKSTIMELSTPFRNMATKKGALYDQFFGDDARRTFKFKMYDGGPVYESDILIDCNKRKMIATLKQDGEPLTDKLEEYDALVERIVGNENLFFKSVFVPQKSQNFLDMTDTPLKSTLMGLFDLIVYSDVYLKMVSNQLTSIDKEIAVKRTRISTLQEDIERSADIEAEVDQLTVELDGDRDNRDGFKKDVAQCQDKISAVKEKIARIESDRELFEELEKQRRALQLEINDIREDGRNKLHDIENSIESARTDIDDMRNKRKDIVIRRERLHKIISNKDKINSSVDKIKALRKKLTRFTSEAEKLLPAMQRVTEIISKIGRNEDRLQSIGAELERLQSTASILDEVPCRGMDIHKTCKLLKQANEAVGDIEKNKAEYKLLSGELATLEKEKEKLKKDTDRRETIIADMEDVEKELAGLEKDRWESLRDELGKAEIELKGLDEQVSSIDDQIDKADKVISGLMSQAEKVKPGIEQRVAAKNKQLAELDDKIKAQEAKQGGTTELQNELKELDYQLMNHNADYQRSLTVISDKEARIKSLRDELRSLDEKRKTVTGIEVEIASELRDYEEWSTLKKAMKDIPVLEMEVKAQILTKYINQSLQNMFNAGITIELITQKPMKKKDPDTGDPLMKDVFKFVVYRDDDEVDAVNLSGGEKDIGNAAIRMAIEATLSDVSDHQYYTSFWDESDGSLDLDRAISFYDTLQDIHKYSGKRYTFMITHRPEIQALIPQKINIKETKG